MEWRKTLFLVYNESRLEILILEFPELYSSCILKSVRTRIHVNLEFLLFLGFIAL
jgi:hypothetical protein